MPVVKGTYKYWLAPHVWDVIYGGWVRPVGTVGGVDLRTERQCGLRETVEGLAFVAIDPAAPAPKGGVYLGDDLNAEPPDRIAAEQALGLSSGDLAGLTVIVGGFAVLTEYSDPQGLTRVRSLTPNREGELAIKIQGHSTVYKEKFQWGVHPHTAKVLSLLRSEFAIEKARDISNDSDHYKRSLTALVDKYGLDSKEIDTTVSPLSRLTTITDSFTDSDAVSLDAHTGEDGTWIEILGTAWQINTNNAFRIGNSSDMAIHEDILSDDAHFAEVEWLDHSGAGAAAGEGPVVRNPDKSTVQGYSWRNRGNQVNTIFEKWTAGTPTDLGQIAYSLSANEVMKLDVSGGNFEFFIDDVSKATDTDSTFATGKYVGIYGQGGGGGQYSRIDNFFADDGAAGGGGRIMSSLAAAGGLAGFGGIAGKGGGLAG